MRTPKAHWLLVALIGACGTPYLEGSLGEVYDLRYTEARVQITNVDLTVSFVNRAVTGTDADGGVVTKEGLPFKLKLPLTQWLVDGGAQEGGVPVGFLGRQVPIETALWNRQACPAAAPYYDSKSAEDAFIWDAEGIPCGVNIDLTQENQVGAQRGSYTHVDPASDDTVFLPRASSAELYFERVPEREAAVSGAFHVTFENGTEPASGRTVFGSFKVKEVQ